MLKIFIYLSLLFSFCLSKIHAQKSTNYFVPPFQTKGIEVSSTFKGSVLSYETAYNSCGLTTPPKAVYLGSTGAFSYTLNFSKPINEIDVLITATGNPGEETFVFNTNTGVPQVIEVISCYSRLDKNTLISGLNSIPEGGGGLFTIRSELGFMNLIISGEGGFNGSLFAFGSEIIGEKCEAESKYPEIITSKYVAECNEKNFNLKQVEIKKVEEKLELTWHSSKLISEKNRIKDMNVKSGTYYASFYDKKNNCYSSKFSSVDVTLKGEQKIYAGKDFTVCEGEKVTLVAKGGKKYIWDNNVKQNIAFNLYQTTKFSVKGVNDFACPSSDEINVTIIPNPKVNAGNDTSIFESDFITLNATGASTYIWNNRIIQGRKFSPKESGLYIVKGLNESGCFNFDTIQITVNKIEQIQLENIPLEDFSENNFKAVNVVFLIDVSSSMATSDKFELLKISLKKIITLLRPQDNISVMIYSDDAKILIENLSGANSNEMLKIIDELKTTGKTEGIKALKEAFKLIHQNKNESSSNLVFVITDGAFNFKNNDYLKLIEKNAKKGVNFSVVGIKSNANDEKKLRLASEKGNGVFIPIINRVDASKNLVLCVKKYAFKIK